MPGLEETGKALTLAASETDGVVVVKFSGRLTINHVDEVDVFLTKLLGEGGGGIILNLADLTHIVSSGIGVLIAFRERTAKAGRPLAIGGVNPKILKIFQLMSLESFFAIFDAVPQALAEMKGKQG